MGMQSQNISKYSPKVDFEISHTSESSILNCSIDFMLKILSDLIINHNIGSSVKNEKKLVLATLLQDFLFVLLLQNQYQKTKL